MSRQIILILALFLTTNLAGCATAVVASSVTGAVVGTAKVAAKTTVGAGKLAYRGTKAAVSGTHRLVSQSNDDQIVEDRASLPDPE